MKVGIVGAGLIGTRRAEIVRATPGSELAAVADIDLKKAKAVTARFGGAALSRWEDLVSDGGIQAVIVATPNHLLTPVALAAMEQRKHVLIEKPMGRTPEELAKLVESSRKHGVFAAGGFNHRHHPAIRRARELVRQGAIGDLLFIRARYGHGGRTGYEKEWRCQADQSGGGELVDQGIHLIDLARWFLGDFDNVFGWTSTGFWPISPLEDNAFLLLRNGRGQIASLHVSWTQWKNLFSFEVYGKIGSLTIEGLGGSYGVERLIWASRHSSGSGAPEEREEVFPGQDTSWQTEWNHFLTDIQSGRSPEPSAEDGLAAMQIVDAVYRLNRSPEPAVSAQPISHG